MKSGFLKLLGIPVLVIFMNIGFLLFAEEVYTYFHTFVPIFLFNLFVSIDIVIRPTSAEKDEYNRLILITSFLLLPITIIFPYYEYKVILYQMLTPLVYFWMIITGIILLLLGGTLLLVSRIQLGKYGGPRIVIEKEHQLIIKGVYKHIRHPMYLGFLSIFFGYSLALGSLFMTLVICFILFLIFKNRIDIEEKLLLSEFGEEYAKYMKRTKRLFPFLY